MEAADGGGRSGVAQIWQHFLRDVLLEKLQRPSGGGVVAVDHCKDETNVLRCVRERERGRREGENRGHVDRGDGNGGGSSSLARGKSIVARDNASSRVFYSTRVAKYFSLFLKISYDHGDSTATGSTISTHSHFFLSFFLFFLPFPSFFPLLFFPISCVRSLTFDAGVFLDEAHRNIHAIPELGGLRGNCALLFSNGEENRRQRQWEMFIRRYIGCDV